MRALEERSETRAASARWRAAFAAGAETIADMPGGPVLWHDALGIWGHFSTRKDDRTKDWNAFGQRPNAFRSNMVVEVNAPQKGQSRTIQGVFANDGKHDWVLRKGRMSVSGSRVTDEDFAAVTTLAPVEVRFRSGDAALYYPVARIDAKPAAVQESMADFIAQCARARLAKQAPEHVLLDFQTIDRWERGLNPEITGTYDIARRDSTVGYRRHAEVWAALSAELTLRNIPHTTDRVSRYAPDLFTYGSSGDTLFELKTTAGAQDVFTAVGQLHVYEHLLQNRYRKVIVLPKGIAAALLQSLNALTITVLEYEQHGRRVRFADGALDRCLEAIADRHFPQTAGYRSRLTKRVRLGR